MANMNNKKYLLFVLVLVAMLIAGTSALTYAFFAGTTTLDDTLTGNIIANDPSDYLSFSISGDTKLTFSVDARSLTVSSAEDDYSNYVTSDTKSITYSATGITSDLFPGGIKCYYNISYIPVATYTPSTYATNNSLNELTLYAVSGSTVIEQNLASLSTKTLITSSYIQNNTGSTSASQTWNFNIRFYNLAADQSSAMGQTVQGKIAMETTTCEALS